MWLINTETLRREEFTYGNHPSYAILSHTWVHGEEISFRIFQTLEGNTLNQEAKTPSKIIQAAKEALRQGLHYIWIDTCCIDKTSSAELTEAINSQWEWYNASTVCYVYLDDLDTKPDRSTENSILGHCRWFGRGWTLLELLAPRKCIFFDMHWRSIGERDELYRTLSDITSIDESYLRGNASIMSAPISMRMMWMSQRKTTRHEDMAYCMLGLFGINMPLVYGEGDRAYLRLQWEILKETRDEDVFNWYWDDSVPDQWEFIFAPNPICFVPRTGATKCSDHPRWRRNVDKYKGGYSGLMRVLNSDSLRDAMELEACLIPRPNSNMSKMNTSIQRDALRAGSTDGDEEYLDLSSVGYSLDEVVSVFSYNTVSTLQTSANPIYISGVKEVIQTLLSQAELGQLYLTAMTSMTRQKSRAHIRGFLKDYGKRLCDETDNEIEKQAAKFIQESARRLADEIRRRIIGQEELHLPSDEGNSKEHLEEWFNNLADTTREPLVVPQPQASDGSLQDNEFEEMDSDLEEESATEFPRIGQVREFLLSSEAFKYHLKSLRDWLKIEDASSQQAENVAADQPDTEAPISPEETQPARSTLYSDTPETFPETPQLSLVQDIADGSSPYAESRLVSNASQDSETLQLGTSIPSRCSEPVLPVLDLSDSTINDDDVKVIDLLSGLVNFWGISFFFHDVVELFLPSIKPGHNRMRWRCSCDTILWGDFAEGETNALQVLKTELAKYRASKRHNSGQPNHHQSDNGYPSGRPSSPLSGPSRLAHNLQSGGLSRPTQPSRPPTHSPNATAKEAYSINIDNSIPKYFEVCINAGNHALDHYELDISESTSDGALFVKIWEKYRMSRGFGLRRVFLRPRDVHFVMFSINPKVQYGTGIHRKPYEYPPEEELKDKRYHYLCPKMVMPVNVFLHYLHRARWGTEDDHPYDTWLKRLPKKLNESLLLAAQRQAVGADNPDLVFGWGVHIIEGPSHFVLSMMLAAGIVTAFTVSGLVMGVARTQEQGFGVGSFLLAIVASIMAAIYFKLMDK